MIIDFISSLNTCHVNKDTIKLNYYVLYLLLRNQNELSITQVSKRMKAAQFAYLGGQEVIFLLLQSVTALETGGITPPTCKRGSGTNL